jgi:TolB-like protein
VQSRRSRKWIAAAAIAVAAVAIYAIAGRPRPPAAQPIVRAGPSVAVLPFGNARGDSSDDYFSDGMAVDLTAALSKIGGLSVLAPKSAFAFKHGSLTAREIGESLHVSHVLEGTLSRSGNSLRVVPALVDVKTGVAVWSVVYDRESKDVFQVQDDITRAIVQQLRLKLDSAVRTPGSAAARLQAYDLYMRGRFEAAKVTRDGLDRGLRLLQRAVKLDSQSAVSWAGIAGIWNFLADDWVPPRIAYARSAEAASKATQIDSTLAEGHAELGAVKMWSAWDAAAADAEFRRAIAIDPNNLETRIYRGTLFLYRRMPDSALVESQRAQALDPLNASVTILECEALQDLKKWDAAEEKCRSAVKIDESNGETSLSMAAILITRGKLDEAERDIERRAQQRVARAFADLAKSSRLGARDDPQNRGTRGHRVCARRLHRRALFPPRRHRGRSAMLRARARGAIREPDGVRHGERAGARVWRARPGRSRRSARCGAREKNQCCATGALIRPMSATVSGDGSTSRSALSRRANSS